MKRKICILMITMILLVSMLGISRPVYADNTVQTAETIALNENKSFTFYEAEYEHYYKFVPSDNGYYEFQVQNFKEDETYIGVYDATGEEVGFCGWDQFYNDCICVANLKANQTYYVEVHLFTDVVKTATISVKKHKHTLKTDLYQAEYSDSFGYTGYKIDECTRCDYYKHTTINGVKSISLSCKSYTYDGKEKKPSVTVKDTAGKTISASNYTVTYEKGRKKVGKYKVTVKFKNLYTGSQNLYFTINPKGTSIKKLTAQKKAFKVQYNKQKTETTGYQVQYSTSSKFKNAKTTTISKNKTTSTTIKKLSKKKKYYVKVRTYKTVSGKKYYSGWSKVKTVKTK